MKTSNKVKQVTPKQKKSITIISVVTALILIVGIVLAVVLTRKPNGFVYNIPKIQLPTEEMYALHQYDYNNLSDVQTTIRSDTMNVTKRNLKRTTPEILGDDFSLVYNKTTNEMYAEYELINDDANLATATISFNPNNYPEPMKNKASTVNGYAEAAALAGVSANQYFSYYKYMLMTQGQHLSWEAFRRSAETASDTDEIDPNFASWLKKHPAADGQYGAVKGTDNAVQKEITLDPIYRSYHTTGLYLPAGEPVTVKVEGLKAGEYVSVIVGLQNSLAWRGQIPNGGAEDINALINGTGYNSVKFLDSYSDAFFKQADLLTISGNFYKYNTETKPAFLQSQWQRQNARAPWLTYQFNFTENKTYTIGAAFGGVMHIGMGNCYSQVKTTFTGAVETPHYILGSTTPEYFDTYLRQAPGVLAVLDTENGELIGPTGEMGTTNYMRQVKTEEIDKLAMLWHSFISVNESFTGGIYNRFNKIMFDWHVPAGAAVALGNYSFAQPIPWFNDAMNYRNLLKKGTWGTLHEIGHNHSTAYGNVWGFGSKQEGEVRNNALTLLAYIKLCDVGTTIRNGEDAEHGDYANPYSTLKETIANANKFSDFSEAGYFQALGMYANIMHSFGADKYYELMYSYNLNPTYCDNKRADFAYRCSLIYKMNFIKYFNTFYGAKITDEMFTADQLIEMKKLPNYEPVSCFYAGGINGVKTAGDYNVVFGDDITFDLTNNTISTLDTQDKKGFKVISVGNPKHGKIKRASDGTYTYSFNKKYTGAFDEFSFRVKLNDGVIHTLTITLRISYNSARVSTYANIENPNCSGAAMISNLENQILNLVPTFANSASAGIPSYNTSDWQVKVCDFWWKAPLTGEVSLAVSGSNGLCLYYGTDFETLEKTNLIYTAGANYNHSAKLTVKEGEYYAIRVLNTNRGGKGSASVGILGENGRYSQIPQSQIFHPNYPLGKNFEEFVFEPKYLVSQKDNIKLSITGSDKSEWSIVKAPENIVGGRYLEQQLIDPETNKPLEGDGVLVIDKWTYLIDGLNGTNMHTTYGGGVPKITEENPQEFILDTSTKQIFNFFSVTTRNNVNSYITNCELQIADSLDGVWKTIATADRNSYVKQTITMKFEQISGRYLKLIVKGTTGGNFSVLAELDAGIQSKTQQVIPSTSPKFYATKGWKNSVNIDTEPNGYLISEKKNQSLVIKFVGDSFALYAATGENYGSAKVIVDGKLLNEFHLNTDKKESRKLVSNIENLENKEHTVEIITTSANKVMLNIVGLPYSASVLNAPNIYKEKALAITLVVFLLLFLVTLAFVLVLIFVPNFRNKIFGSKLINKLDNREKKPKKDKNSSKQNVEDGSQENNKKIAKENKNQVDNKISNKTSKQNVNNTKSDKATNLNSNAKITEKKEDKKVDNAKQEKNLKNDVSTKKVTDNKTNTSKKVNNNLANNTKLPEAKKSASKVAETKPNKPASEKQKQTEKAKTVKNVETKNSTSKKPTTKK